MEVLGWIRLIIGAGLLFCGLGIFVIEVFGIFHLKYALNRMHAAAMGDTLGISFSLIGLMLFSGLNFTTVKMGLIVVFFWFASPVASHMLARLEATTNKNPGKYYKTYLQLEDLEQEIRESRQQAASEDMKTGGEEG